MKPEEINADTTFLKRLYSRIYRIGGFGYNKETEAKLLWSVFDSKGDTLLDVGCGDGFWTDILAEKYDCSGIDISEKGISIAQLRYPSLRFMVGDFLTEDFQHRKFDIIFMRSPSFLNFPPESKQFHDGIRKAVSICNQDIWYIKWSVLPYDRYDKGSYIHDPAKVTRELSSYGDVCMKFTTNYFYAKLML